MFALLRVVVILAIVLIGFATFKYRRTQDAFWLRLIRWTIFIVLGGMLVMFAGLALDRLAH
ncbi:hypothetical protein IGB42_00878 [Andreprevotia sp. IGB-42]|uniref:hypothetical protein n=1 Tax=Andreprevotia sp. IGB-42 TaxID=2497473 RepID=UPI001357008D|nr:hypothetical protein [Andreprevotia sp. IGB-42]KAF0814823.1 hypothetical protein IGB42_00878 [Andreprevotia sp. IGB-42]